MKFHNGYPNDSGSSDFGDSSRSAGLMAIVDAENTPNLDDYVKSGIMYRLPCEDPFNKGTNNPRNFSRDQTLPLVAGLLAQGKVDTIKEILEKFEKRKWRGQNDEVWEIGSTKKFPNGPDFFTPLPRLAIILASKKNPNLLLKTLGYTQLIFDILIARLKGPKYEINQLIAILYCLQSPYGFKLLKAMHPDFYEHFYVYWCGWRQECWMARELTLLVHRMSTKWLKDL